MKKALLYWVPTGLLLLVMVGSAAWYIMNPDAAAKAFAELGYPAYTMYFNASAKILGAIALLTPQVPRFLKEWAYAGYLFILLLAMQAIFVMMSPAQSAPILIFIGLWALSYWQFTKRV
jgi:hypothetical protein